MAGPAKQPSQMRRFLKPLGRYLPSVLFPVVCFGAIYADWSHTRKWKQEVLALEK